MTRLTPLMLLACCCLPLTASAAAITRQPEPVLEPAPPAVERLVPDTWARAELRPLSMEAAEALLKSTEGPAWRIVQVQAPAPTKKVRHCKPVLQDCTAARKFAKKFRAEVSCSALYDQTTVLLTTAAVPQKDLQAEVPAPRRAVRPAGARPKHKGSGRKDCLG